MLTERSAVIALVYAQAGAQSAPVNVTPQIGRAVGNALGSASSDPVQACRSAKFATLETRRGLEPKCVPQFILGSQSQKSFRKLTQRSFFLVSKVVD